MSHSVLVKTARLKSDKKISELFEMGKSLTSPHVRLTYLIETSEKQVTIKAGFAVPRRNFKRAVDRNLLKRRMREAYRLNKNILESVLSPAQITISLMFIYQADKVEDYLKISDSIISLLKKLSMRYLSK
jgi:ribonuclease P protein component